MQEGGAVAPDPAAAAAPAPAVKTEDGGGTTDDDVGVDHPEKRPKRQQEDPKESELAGRLEKLESTFAGRLAKWEVCSVSLPTRPSSLARSDSQGSFPGQEADAFAKESRQEGDAEEHLKTQGPWMTNDSMSKMEALTTGPDGIKPVHIEKGMEVRLAPTPLSEVLAVFKGAPVPAYHVPEGVHWGSVVSEKVVVEGQVSHTEVVCMQCHAHRPGAGSLQPAGPVG